MTPSIWVVIPSAGKGKRFGSALPKQYQMLLGKTVLQNTVDRFLNRSDVKGVVLAVNKKDYQHYPVQGDQRLIIVEGGDERSDSVLNALKYVQQIGESNDFIAVHDAARPCIRQSSLSDLFRVASRSHSGAILALPATDTVKWVKEAEVDKTIDREFVYMAQTPQIFNLSILLKALESAKVRGLTITDESSAVELLGICPQIVLGKKDNIKITSLEDLALAEYFLENIHREND